MLNRLASLRRSFLALLVICLCNTQTIAEEIDLFIVTGQSNARIQYALGINSALRAIGRYENPVVFNATRSGNWLSQWIGDGPDGYEYSTNFTQDLWNAEGTSKLQQFIADLEADGDTVVVRGFFWWQGEGDTGSAAAQAVYSDKLQWMVQELESKYNEFDTMFTLIDYNHNLLDDLTDINRDPEDVEAIRDALRDAADALGGAVHDSRPYPRADLWHVSDWDDHRGFYGPAFDLGADQARSFVDHVFCEADLNNDHETDYFDLQVFLGLLMKGCP